MARYFRAGVLFISLIIPGLQAPILSAQQSKAAVAPIPEQVLAAKTRRPTIRYLAEVPTVLTTNFMRR
jgi:hypothetical protein